MEQDYDIENEFSCPKCGHSPLHSRDCTNFCDMGEIDESEDDPINFMPGESRRICPSCRGTEIERWCPSCGVNLSGVEIAKQEEANG